MDNTLEKLFEVLDVIVRGDDRPWHEKKLWILKNSSEEEQTNLAEFVAWFEADE